MGDVLIVDDERDIRELISEILQDEGFETRMAANSDQAMAEINAKAPDMMILDIWLKDSEMDGIDILTKTKRDNPDIPIVIISGHGNIEIAVAAIKQGAFDFIEKPFNIDQLLVVIGRAMEVAKLRKENNSLRGQSATLDKMIGASSAFRAMVSQLDMVTKSNARVMLTGPSGSGKEVAARYIHAHSNRANAPFVTVNCAGVEPEHMESLLFGHKDGREGMQAGLFEQAHGGVLFLDEVADMPMGTQSKILRVLVDQQFERVGGSDRVRVDVRVISSTSKDLRKAIDEERFRAELYHRLNVVPIEVPPLSARSDDIPLLADYFLDDLHAHQGLPKRRLNADAVTALQTMEFPGNIRQLRNVIERVLILGIDRAEIGAEEISREDEPAADKPKATLPQSMANVPLREAREMFEREYLLAQINRFGGNISRTSEFVGMERSALHRKLKSLGVVTSQRAGAKLAFADEREG